MVSTYPSEKVRRTLYLIQFWLKNKLWIYRNPEMSAQSNLDYPDFLTGQSWSRSVAVFFLNLQRLKVK